MRLHSSVLQLAFLAPLALASIPPACSSTSVTPCSCPAGTVYQESVTFAVIGAPATAVRSILGSFFKTAWFGLLPYATTGEDFHPGATRSYTFPTGEGIYNLTEQLTLFKSSPSGSFVWKFELAPFDVPTEYYAHNGTFGGYWATMRSDEVFQNETTIVWSVYECATGYPLNYAAFQAGALNNTIKMLTSEGKVTGTSLGPASIQDFVSIQNL